MGRITTLHIGEQSTRLTTNTDPGMDSVLSLGTHELGAGPWRNEPPSPLELENAIAFAEDLLMPLMRALPAGTTLVTHDAHARHLVVVARPGEDPAPPLHLAQVEQVFNSLVAVSLGRPIASSGLPTRADFAAYVLILRELMHHLGFDTITVKEPIE
ncbi:MAG: hypothetical protein AB7S86_06845 [Hydrogenophaga sp.]|uniref:hypothetical protein n=1 Tax=Hydrogenophaga sp. TaxID=1904254 RepID=UPI003D13ABD5